MEKNSYRQQVCIHCSSIESGRGHQTSPTIRRKTWRSLTLAGTFFFFKLKEQIQTTRAFIVPNDKLILFSTESSSMAILFFTNDKYMCKVIHPMVQTGFTLAGTVLRLYLLMNLEIRTAHPSFIPVFLYFMVKKNIYFLHVEIISN